MISAPASCPPAALVELSDRNIARAEGDLHPIYWRLARVFVETGHLERAMRYLDAIEAGAADEAATDDAPRGASQGIRAATARTLQSFGEWERALDALGDAATSVGSDEARIGMRSLLELGRYGELELLAVASVRAGDDCRPLELLMEAWRRQGLSRGLADLEEALEELGPVTSRTSARVAALWDSAFAHSHVLAMDVRYSGPQLTLLLDRPGHEADVLARLEAGGTALVDDLLERLTVLLAAATVEDARIAVSLVRVLAETGDARVLPTIEALAGDDAESALARWRAANGLRQELEEDAPR